MNILVIGSGGREHAFAWKIRQSRHCTELFVAPGNAGTSSIATNVAIGAEDFDALGKFCAAQSIGLVVVGPEAPLVKGIRDFFEQTPGLQNIPIVGPGKAGAQLEGSKDFSKQFMVRHSIPTARARTFDSSEVNEATRYLATCNPPIVLKADGLAAGKGVLIVENRDEAAGLLREMLVEKKFGEASTKVLIEEFLSGIELSVFVLTDGKDYLVLPEAKDYKRIGEKDTGPNTGGMGAVSPVAFADSGFMKKVEDRIIKPTIDGLRRDGIDYRGFIFIGLMNCGGDPFVIEYNARMGDPETQAVLPRIKNDFVELLLGAATGKLGGLRVDLDNSHAVTVVMASGGYPGDYSKGKLISGLDAPTDALLFQAGTRLKDIGVVTDGGRVMAVTGLGSNLEEAREKALAAVAKLNWEGLYFRKDIGLDLAAFQYGTVDRMP
jgi:phosphoribosylamine--glycine ligase